MSDRAATIEKFYRAFQAKDAATMATCYHPDVTFSDPVFIGLKGAQAGAMWKMLCARGKDLTIEFRDVAADGAQGTAHWDARYTFSQTKRPVLNRIDARFRFADDGRIVEHVDSFNLWHWSSQALGPVGFLLGWSPPVRGAIRRNARKALDAWIAEHGT